MRAYYDNQTFIILSIILLTKYAVCARNYNILEREVKKKTAEAVQKIDLPSF